MVYRSTLFVGSSSFVFQVEIRIWSVFFFVEGDGERKPLEQHQIKHICNARSGNQTGTLSPSRHPCPPREIPSDVPPPLAPRNNLPNTTFVFYLRTLPLNIMPPTSIWTLQLDITFRIFSPDLILRSFPTDIPDEHSPPTDSFPSLADIVNLFVCLFFFFYCILRNIQGPYSTQT